eukprot:TRINITY_DN9789_c0_g1_i2.p1 TRINITY_DN9789_c0_g1~~TRINITY_DN9789_c0_g1_i2.p1  ORF type:complete len:369 (+),score=81.09 TRINITY_DN9789_c0_g1_i2:25-1131(+)
MRLACFVVVLWLAAITKSTKFGNKKIPSDYSFDSASHDHTQAGIAFDEKNQRQLALKAFQAAVRFNPNDNTYGNLGVVLMRMAKYEEALKVMKKALKLNPQSSHHRENYQELVGFMKGKDKNFQDEEPTSTGYPSSSGSDDGYADDDGYAEYEDDDVNADAGQSAPRVSLSTVDVERAYKLAEPPDEPRQPITTKAAKFPSAPPTTVQRTHRADVLHFIQTEFRSRYFEQFPVLIETEGAFVDTLTLEQALTKQRLKYNGNKYEAPYRNVKFIKGSFMAKDESGMKDEAALAQALRNGYTLQLYGIQSWLPSVATLSYQLSKFGIGLPGTATATGGMIPRESCLAEALSSSGFYMSIILNIVHAEHVL